jgi:hypothetical protein
VANGTAQGGTSGFVLTPDVVDGLARDRDPTARFARDFDHTPQGTLGACAIVPIRRGLPMDNDNRPPICPRCGVTMVPAALSADDNHEGDWVCLECEELEEDE